MLKKLNAFFEKQSDAALLFLRLGIAITFITHGMGALLNIGPWALGIEGTSRYLASLGIPLSLFFAWVIALNETFSGLCILLGLHTRIAAFFLSIEMLIAIFVAHLPHGFYASQGELALLLLAGCLTLLFAGAGKRWKVTE